MMAPLSDLERARASLSEWMALTEVEYAHVQLMVAHARHAGEAGIELRDYDDGQLVLFCPACGTWELYGISPERLHALAERFLFVDPIRRAHG